MIPRTHTVRLWLTVLALAGPAATGTAQEVSARRGANTRPDRIVTADKAAGDAGTIRVPAVRTNVTLSLPPLPDGVAELKFGDFFKLPVGAFGLELTDKVRSLAGRRVRVLGYMVREEVEKDGGEEAAAGIVRERLLVTPAPVTISYGHYGLSDDLPPQTLFVTVAEPRTQPVPHRRGLLLLTGTLDIGNRTEPDGRVSAVRLKLDPQSSAVPGPRHPDPSEAARTTSPQLVPSVQNHPQGN